jgi:FkbM family methyltransferase
LVFDIGSNVGEKAELFMQLGAKVVAVEPNKKLVEILKIRFQDKLRILNIGVGEQNELKDFYVGSNHLVSTFSDNYVDYKKEIHSSLNYNKSEQIQINTLDTLIKEIGMPDFCKIDVEGYEKSVIRGLSQKNKCLCFELNTPAFNQDAIDNINHLTGLGYKEFNFTLYENYKFELLNWVSGEELIHLVSNDERFSRISYLDIYAR